MPVRRAKRRRKLHPDQQRKIALEMLAGKPIKMAAYDYDISESQSSKIFHKYIKWKMVWRN